MFLSLPYILVFTLVLALYSCSSPCPYPIFLFLPLSLPYILFLPSSLPYILVLPPVLAPYYCGSSFVLVLSVFLFFPLSLPYILVLLLVLALYSCSSSSPCPILLRFFSLSLPYILTLDLVFFVAPVLLCACPCFYSNFVLASLSLFSVPCP